MHVMELSVEDLSTVLLVHDTFTRVHATVYAVVVSRKRAALSTLTIEDLQVRTSFPEAMIYQAVVDLVQQRLLHWTVIASNRSQSRVTIA